MVVIGQHFTNRHDTGRSQPPDTLFRTAAFCVEVDVPAITFVPAKNGQAEAGAAPATVKRDGIVTIWRDLDRAALQYPHLLLRDLSMSSLIGNLSISQDSTE